VASKTFFRSCVRIQSAGWVMAVKTTVEPLDSFGCGFGPLFEEGSLDLNPMKPIAESFLLAADSDKDFWVVRIASEVE